MVARKSITLLHAYEAEIRRLKERLQSNLRDYEKDLKEATATAMKVVRRSYELSFAHFRDENVFEVRATIQPRMLMTSDRHEIEFIARHISQDVYQEIATCRFMVPANYKHNGFDRVFTYQPLKG